MNIVMTDTRKWVGSRYYLLSITLMAIIITVSRRPDAFFNAQFWAEDAVIWYAEAYSKGWLEPIFSSQNGYFQTVSRLVAAGSMAVDFKNAPLFFNVCGAFFQILPALILNSARGRELVPNDAARLLVTLLYLAIPYAQEVHVNTTNIHWHLALASLLIMSFSYSSGWPQKVFDGVVVLLSALSGPFSILMSPLSVYNFYIRRDKRSALIMVAIVACALLQGITLAMTIDEGRSLAPLGASWVLLFKVFSGQVVLGGIFGDAWVSIYNSRLWASWLFAVAVSGVAAALIAYCLLKAPHAVKLTIMFAGTLLAAAFVSPQISLDQPQWQVWNVPYSANRYSFIPIVGLAVCLVWAGFAADSRIARGTAFFGLVLMCFVGVPYSWKLPPYADLEFKNHARALEQAEPGEIIQIPVNPGGGWSVTIIKKE